MGCLLCGEDRFESKFELRGYPIQRCVACNLTQIHPAPDAETLSELYDDAYFEDGGESGYADYSLREAEYRSTFREELRRIESRFPAGRNLRLLDVGCGPGVMLGVADERGHTALGIDVIESVVKQAQHRFPGRVFHGTLDDHPHLASKSFDVVFASHVIEHIADPLTFTRSCMRLLSADGLLVFVTPNIRSWLARISGRRWVSYKVPEHVAYYDPSTMRDLFARAGMEAVAIQSAYESHNIEFLARRVRRLVHPVDKVFPRIERWAPIGNVVVRVTSGSMRAIARLGNANHTRSNGNRARE